MIIKQSSIQPPTGIFFHNTNEKRYVGGLYTWLFYDHPYLVPLLFAILLSLHLVTFVMFFITCLKPFFFAAGACLSWAITQPQKSVLTRQHIYSIESGISYTGSIGWRITNPSICSNTESTLPLMDDKVSSPCLKTGGTHRSGIQKAWIILHLFIHSFIHSFRYSHIYDRDLPQSFQVPSLIDNTTHTRIYRFFNPMPMQRLYF